MAARFLPQKNVDKEKVIKVSDGDWLARGKPLPSSGASLTYPDGLWPETQSINVGQALQHERRKG